MVRHLPIVNTGICVDLADLLSGSVWQIGCQLFLLAQLLMSISRFSLHALVDFSFFFIRFQMVIQAEIPLRVPLILFIWEQQTLCWCIPTISCVYQIVSCDGVLCDVQSSLGCSSCCRWIKPTFRWIMRQTIGLCLFFCSCLEEGRRQEFDGTALYRTALIVGILHGFLAFFRSYWWSLGFRKDT